MIEGTQMLDPRFMTLIENENMSKMNIKEVH